MASASQSRHRAPRLVNVAHRPEADIRGRPGEVCHPPRTDSELHEGNQPDGRFERQNSRFAETSNSRCTAGAMRTACRVEFSSSFVQNRCLLEFVCSLIQTRIFPVLLSRESHGKPLNRPDDWAVRWRHESQNSRNSQLIALLAGNSGAETGSNATASATMKSLAFLSLRGLVFRFDQWNDQ